MASPASAAAQQAGGGEGAATRPTAEQAPSGAGPQQPAAAGSMGAAGATGAPPAPAAALRARSSATVQMSTSRALRMPGSSAPRYWEMRVVMHANDVNAGLAYYTHPDTGHTQWEIPPCPENGFALVPLRPIVCTAAAGSYTGEEGKENASGDGTMQQFDSGKKRGRAPDVAPHTAADRHALVMQLHKEICERTKAAWDLPLVQQAKELHALTLLSDKRDTMTAMLNSEEAVDWHMKVDRAPGAVYYTNVHSQASQWLPPIVEGGFNLVPLHQAKERSDPGSRNEERAGGNSAAQTYDSDKKCKAATPTASQLRVEATLLHEEIRARVSAVSHMDPGAQAREMLTIQELCEKFDAMAAQLNTGIGQK